MDEEGNLMVGDVALKQFDVKPINVDYHLQQYEEHPILKLKVRIYMYMSCTWYDVPSAYLSKSTILEIILLVLAYMHCKVKYIVHV